jgi:hypothetical protein
MSYYEFWNDVGILALTISAGFNVLYFFRHANGKKYVRLISGAVLAYALVLRLLMAFGGIQRTDYSNLIVMVAWLIYLLPAADAFIDWQGKRKSE